MSQTSVSVLHATQAIQPVPLPCGVPRHLTPMYHHHQVRPLLGCFLLATASCPPAIRRQSHHIARGAVPIRHRHRHAASAASALSWPRPRIFLRLSGLPASATPVRFADDGAADPPRSSSAQASVSPRSDRRAPALACPLPRGIQCVHWIRIRANTCQIVWYRIRGTVKNTTCRTKFSVNSPW